MSKAKTMITAAVNAALAAGAEPIVEVTAVESTVTAKMIAAVREYAAMPAKGKAHGWEFVSEFTDDDITEVIEGALTAKTAIKKMSRKLYKQVDPYGTFAKRAAEAQVAA